MPSLRSSLLTCLLLTTLTTASRSEARPARARSLKGAFALLRQPVASSPWRNVRWADVRRRVQAQLKDPNTLDQGKLHLCMSAVALNLTAKVDPQRYVQLVREVYEHGTFNGRPVSRKLLNATPKSTQPLDWMMLSASRNAYGRPGFGGETGFRLSAINLPAGMTRQLEEVAGYAKTESLSRLFKSGADLIPRLNAQLQGGGDAVLLMSMKGLRPGLGHHNLHWTRLVGKIEQLPAAVQVQRPAFDAHLGTHVVRWQEADGRRGEKALGTAKEARTFARMLGRRRVKATLFDHGKALPIHVSERTFGRQLLWASLATLGAGL